MLATFDNVQIQWVERNVFRIEAPWIQIEGRCHESDRTKIERARRTLLSQEERKFCLDLQWLLAQLSHLPITYQVPRKLSLDPRSRFSFPKTSLTEESIDLDNIIQKCQTPDFGLSDPLTLLGILRSERQKLRRLNPYKLELFRALNDTNQNKLRVRRMVQAFVVQNHHITSVCCDALKSALPLAGQTREQLEAFIKAETGHDSLLADSIRSLGDAAGISVLPAIEKLGSLLKEVAEHSFLTTCLLIDYFEEGPDSDAHPLDQLIARSSLSEQCRGYLIHKRINFDGHHAQVANELLESAQGFSIQEAKYALKTFASIMHLEIAVAKEMMTLIERL